MSDAHPPAAHAEKKTNKGARLISNALAIAGFIILFVIIIWGLVHIASLSSGFFSSLFPGSTQTSITVHAPQNTVSGEPVQITWNYSTKTSGRFAFLYACEDGVQVAVPVLKQGATQPTLATVPCGAAFALGNATSSVVIVPVSSNASSTSALLSILFVPSSGGEARGSATMNITPAGAPATPSSTPSAPATAEPSAPRAPADLSVTLLSESIDPSGASIISFDIANDGGSASGTYSFSASLPTSQPYTFISDPQASLAAGAHIVNTLRFTQTVNGTFTVIVDPSNGVRESNENNNVASEQIATPYNYNYTPTQNYSSYSPSGYPVYSY